MSTRYVDRIGSVILLNFLVYENHIANINFGYISYFFKAFMI